MDSSFGGFDRNRRSLCPFVRVNTDPVRNSPVGVMDLAPVIAPPTQPGSIWGGFLGAAVVICAFPEICSEGGTMLRHARYVQSGMTNQAATFAAGRL
jgi:hypothetical protein